MRISDWSSDVCSSDLDEAQVYARENAGKRVQVDADALRALVRNLRGLNLTDARRIARHLIFRDGAIGHNDLPELNKLKFELLNRSGHLRFERSEERRVRKECVSTCRSRGSPDH